MLVKALVRYRAKAHALEAVTVSCEKSDYMGEYSGHNAEHSNFHAAGAHQ